QHRQAGAATLAGEQHHPARRPGARGGGTARGGPRRARGEPRPDPRRHRTGAHGVPDRRHGQGHRDGRLAPRRRDRPGARRGDRGLGAGARPEAGRAAAEASRDESRAAIEGAHMVFLTAGMGKGTGTGASPLVAEIAQELGVLTVGVVTKPFEFEGAKKAKIADDGIEQLVGKVDSLIVVLNQKLFEVMDEDASLEDAFRRADDVLNNAVAGIAEIINVPGLVNVDFADVKTVMGDKGKAM